MINWCQMFVIPVLSLLFVHTACAAPQSSLRKWFNDRFIANATAPVTYVIRFQDDDDGTSFSNLQSNRNAESQTTGDTIFAKFVVDDGNTVRKRRNDNQKPAANVRVNANVIFHHNQQRYPNGNISGTYANTNPIGHFKVTRFVNDGRGFRALPQGGERHTAHPSGHIDIVTNSNNGMVLDTDRHKARRGINPLDGSNLNFVPAMNPMYSLPAPIAGISPTPILESALGTVGQYAPRSPLFDKYYRPSADEVQRTYDYHRIRTSLDPAHFRPTDMTPIPDLPPRDNQPELRGVYGEYHLPYGARYQGNAIPATAYYTGGAPPPIDSAQYYGVQAAQPQYASPLMPLGAAAPLPYQQPYGGDGQQFVPASAFGGPYLPNAATYNQPYPTNVPIYHSSPVSQSFPPTFGQPEMMPVYAQPQMPVYGHNMYYASASGPRPSVTTKQ